ncbi:Uma2 family endonuclease [Leptolyngbya sp. FACHB-402]|nr:Uma2 family endonuclease [Leptolyngbya sp. FACHB-161]MBD2376029.1 Uma2 family endonuclease [Leptolyngbya sp. FACHB-238]MBD2400305.1 Uma2 family endonuclease [Leptolyngbya sp. FACHB-239]MBD2406846.1 Uma2 family endonuclease [Leptolyngbya sp. FACHB-402]
MMQALEKPISFDEFIAWYPENTGIRYELHNGVIVEMPKPRGRHSRASGDLAFDLGSAIRQAKLPYFIPKECIVKVLDQSGYEPDIIVLDEIAIVDEPRWERESVIERAASIRLIVEVVSTNWRDDYLTKLAGYEAFGIPEYWIVDYAALGGKRFIGDPKTPTLSIYTLDESGEYQFKQFRGNDLIESPTFPNLRLTAGEVLDR